MKMKWASLVLVCVVSGCFDCDTCGSSGQKEETSEGAAAVGGNVIVLDVQKMACEQGCATRVEQILADFPGVEKASVDFSKKMAYLTPKAGEALDMNAVVKALADAGYPATIHSES